MWCESQPRFRPSIRAHYTFGTDSLQQTTFPPSHIKLNHQSHLVWQMHHSLAASGLSPSPKRRAAAWKCPPHLRKVEIRCRINSKLATKSWTSYWVCVMRHSRVYFRRTDDLSWYLEETSQIFLKMPFIMNIIGPNVNILSQMFLFTPIAGIL